MKRLELKNIIKESITDYLSELNTVTEEEKTEETPKETKEALGTSAPGTMFEDKVTKDSHIYLVKKAMNESTEKDLVEKKYQQYRDEEAIAWVRSMGKPNV